MIGIFNKVQNKVLITSRRTRKVTGPFEKWAPGVQNIKTNDNIKIRRKRQMRVSRFWIQWLASLGV